MSYMYGKPEEAPPKPEAKRWLAEIDYRVDESRIATTTLTFDDFAELDAAMPGFLDADIIDSIQIYGINEPQQGLTLEEAVRDAMA
jgi:hypothetical protein